MPVIDPPLRLKGNLYGQPGYFKTDVSKGVTRTPGGQRICTLPSEFLLGFRDALIYECGKAYRKVMKAAGKKWGVRFAARFDKDVSAAYQSRLRDLPAGLVHTSLADAFAANGYGRLEIDLSQCDSGIVIADVRDPVMPSLVREADRPVDLLTAGMLGAVSIGSRVVPTRSRDHPSGAGRTRRGTSARRRPPRREAGQHPVDPRWCQQTRRPRAGGGCKKPGGKGGIEWCRRGHGWLHGPRTGHGKCRRPPCGSVLPWLHAVPSADGPASILGPIRTGGVYAAHASSSGPPTRGRTRGAALALEGRHDDDGKVPGRPLPGLRIAPSGSDGGFSRVTEDGGASSISRMNQSNVSGSNGFWRKSDSPQTSSPGQRSFPVFQRFPPLELRRSSGLRRFRWVWRSATLRWVFAEAA